MTKINLKKICSWLLIFFAGALFGLAIAWTIYLHRAHSSFEAYYAFRGCTRLISRTDNDGVCQLATGQTIKLVKYQGTWYLDGDLPTCRFFGKCF